MKKIKISILLAISFFSFASVGFISENSAFANEIKVDSKFQKIDALLEKLSTNNKFMGSIAIRKNNELVYNKAYGFSSISDKENKKASTKTKYRIGSITKVFTTVMIFQLIEEKKLTLNTKLSDFFPKIKNADLITIEHLLSHRSGIHNFTNDESYLTYYTQAKTQAEMMEIISKAGSDFEPNKKAEYSNSNFVLLGYIIEKLTKKDYEINLNDRIINKLGLTNTYYGKATDLNNNDSYSYTLKNKKISQEPETDMSIPHGAGAIVSNPEDLTYFISALFDGKLITSDSLKEMKTIKDDYGRGIFQIPFYDRFAFGHNGGIDGFTSMLAYFPDDKVSIAITNNYLKYSSNEILLGILSFYYDKNYEMPSFTNNSIVEVKPEILKSYEGLYSSKKIALKITTKVINGELTAQATGQSSFPLSAISENEFIFEDGGIEIVFSKDKKEFTLKQGGNNIVFIKD